MTLDGSTVKFQASGRADLTDAGERPSPLSVCEVGERILGRLSGGSLLMEPLGVAASALGSWLELWPHGPCGRLPLSS